MTRTIPLSTPSPALERGTVASNGTSARAETEARCNKDAKTIPEKGE